MTRIFCTTPKRSIFLPLLETRCALQRADNLRDANAEVLVNDDNLAFRQILSVDHDIHRFSGKFIQLYNRALRQIENVLDRLLCSAELDIDLKGHIQNKTDISIIDLYRNRT